MLTNNVKLIGFAKPVWRNYACDTYCQLRNCRDKYRNFVLGCGYSTRRNERKHGSRTQTDPRVEALREKLIYCDHLDRHKVKIGYMKRYILKKIIEENESKARMAELMNTPVYSILLDKDDSRLEENSAEETAAKPIYMPYASTDKYSTDNASNISSHDSDHFDGKTIPLSSRYKELYDKYLALKATSETGEVSLKEYLEEVDANESDSTSSVPFNWMVDVEQYDDSLMDTAWLSNYGTPDPNSDVSSVPCGGCGALLHCKDHAVPGYLPSELFLKKSDRQLRLMICQRCHFMRYYNTTLEVKVPPDEYEKLLKVIKRKKCAVILMVDLLDFPCSLWPQISSVLNPLTPVFLVGNKVDLLPQDSPQFFNHVKKCLSAAVENVGVRKEMIKHVALVSAKTGYGIEELINKLHKLWDYKGDVYVIGCTNVGKSTLFNALLQSDYCKVQAVDLIQRATISPWPGTTLNLLKFPILNPQKWRLYLRTQRLMQERTMRQDEEKFRNERFRATRDLRYASLQSHIGRTFYPKSDFEVQNDLFAVGKYDKTKQQFGFDETKEEYKYSRWCYDTPGTIQPDQILDLLTTRELLTVLPRSIISPRTFVLHTSQTIFLGGLGRLDYLDGNDFLRCTIFSSNELPVTLTRTEDADEVYAELLKTEAFVVPESSPDRLKHWPELMSKEMEVTAAGKNASVADVVLSSAGWIAIAGEENERVLLRAWSPQGRGLYLRTPALLRKSVTLRGGRVQDAPTYRRGRQAYSKES